jgi:hypothetical protein
MEVIESMEFPSMQSQQVKELKCLIKYSITLLSLINLNSLAEGFNQNKNILNLPANDFIALSESGEYHSLQQFLNFKRTERSTMLEAARDEVRMLTSRPMISSNPFLADILNLDYRVVNFQQIKSAYRFVPPFLFRS